MNFDVNKIKPVKDIATTFVKMTAALGLKWNQVVDSLVASHKV